MTEGNVGWGYLLPRAANMHKKKFRQMRQRIKRAGTPSTTSIELEALGRARRTVVHPAQPTSMRRPGGLSRADWRAFRIRDVDFLPEQFVLELSGVTVQSSDGWVYCDGKIVSDLWQEVGYPTTSMAVPSGPLGTPLRLQGTTCSLLLPWMPNYYHWTLQSVPRFDMVARTIEISGVDNWLVPKPTRFVTEWLDRLEIPTDRRVVVEDRNRVIDTERLVVASIPGRNRYIPKWVIADLVGRMQPERREAPTLLFVDRPTTDKRRLLNHDAVLEVARDHGFDTVELAGKSVEEQAALFATADVILAVLGAGLTNMAYCTPGTSVIEILPANHLFPAYFKLADAADLDHRIVRGTEQALPGLLRFPDTESDVIADIPGLRATLDDVLRRRSIDHG